MSTLLDKFFSIFFKLPDGRSLETYYKTIGMIAEIATADFITGKTFPTEGVITAASMDTVKEYFVESSQIYKDAIGAFYQDSNTQTPADIDYLLIFEKTSDDATFAAALDRAKDINTVFAQVTTTSRTPADIIDVAGWSLLNKRFLTFTTDVDDIAELNSLKTGLNNYCYGLVRSSANLTQGIGSAVAATTTRGYFGASAGSAQFTQLVGITPELLSDAKILACDNANLAYYSNVSPLDGAGAEDFGYNWVIGSKMVGGELRQRMMIMDYVDKALALLTLEFLNGKPSYDESGNSTLWGMGQVKFQNFQTYQLVTNDADVTGIPDFVFNVQQIRGSADSIQNTNEEAYKTKSHIVSGYYYDKIASQKVDFYFVVDPTSQEVEQLLV